MKPQKALDLASSISGQLISGDAHKLVNSISIDSRTLKSGDLFMALKGETFDGHDFVHVALARGAVGFVTEEWNERQEASINGFKDIIVIQVNDTLTALQQLAHDNRKKSPAKVVGITGSTGKTSTKNFLENILAEGYKVTASPKNFNNEIGVPLTILKAQAEVDVLVLEMGMRGLGQIAALCDIAEPDIGIITNIGDTHIGMVGTRNLIAKAKGELMQALPSEGVAILNADDSWYPMHSRLTKAKVVTFGLTTAADFCASDIKLDREAKANFIIRTRGEKYNVNLSVPGMHTVYNALAAAAAACCLGVDGSAIIDGLAKTKATDMRLYLDSTSNGVIILNDSYNANPASMKAALETAAAINGVNRRIAVLGDMAELGGISEKAHYEIGRIAADLGMDLLVTVGTAVRNLNEGAIAAGFAKNHVHSYRSNIEALNFLRSFMKPNDLVLVKASRCMEFEQIAEGLKEK